MSIRPIRPDEVERFRRISSHAFVLTPDWEERLFAADFDLSTTRALFVDGQMRSVLRLLPMEVWFHQTVIPMGGIAWVATAPEERRRGYVRRLLKHCLQEMRQGGLSISMLYPFSFEYYRKFGYEHCGDWKTYTLDPKGLSGITAPPGEIVPVGPETIPAIDGVYAAFSQRRTCSLIRSESYWRDKVMKGYKRPRYTYLWRSKRMVGGYIIYEIIDHGDFQRTLQVRELVALDHEARCGLLNFLYNHDSQAQKVELTVPVDDVIVSYLNNPRVEVRIKPSFMARLVDVKLAWESKIYRPESKGQVVFQLQDALAPWNSGVFRLVVEGGRGTLEATKARADMTTNARTLSQIYCGYRTLEEAVESGRLEVHRPAMLEVGRALFHESRPYMNDIF